MVFWPWGSAALPPCRLTPVPQVLSVPFLPLLHTNHPCSPMFSCHLSRLHLHTNACPSPVYPGHHPSPLSALHLFKLFSVTTLFLSMLQKGHRCLGKSLTPMQLAPYTGSTSVFIPTPLAILKSRQTSCHSNRPSHLHSLPSQLIGHILRTKPSNPILSPVRFIPSHSPSLPT